MSDYNSFVSVELLADGLTINAARILTYFIDCLPEHATFIKACAELNIAERTAKRCFNELQLKGLIHLNNTTNIYTPINTKLPILFKDALSEKIQYRQSLKPNEPHKRGLPIFSRQDLKQGLKFLFYQEKQRIKIAEKLELNELTQPKYIILLAVFAYLSGTNENTKLLPNAENLAKILGLSSRLIKDICGSITEKIGFNFLVKNTYINENINAFKQLFKIRATNPQPDAQPDAQPNPTPNPQPRQTSQPNPELNDIFADAFKVTFDSPYIEFSKQDSEGLKSIFSKLKSSKQDFIDFFAALSKLKKYQSPLGWRIKFLDIDFHTICAQLTMFLSGKITQASEETFRERDARLAREKDEQAQKRLKESTQYDVEKSQILRFLNAGIELKEEQKQFQAYKDMFGENAVFDSTSTPTPDAQPKVSLNAIFANVFADFFKKKFQTETIKADSQALKDIYLKVGECAQNFEYFFKWLIHIKEYKYPTLWRPIVINANFDDLALKIKDLQRQTNP